MTDGNQLEIFDIFTEKTPKVGDAVIGDDYSEGIITDKNDTYYHISSNECEYLVKHEYFKYFFKVIEK